MVNMSEIDEAFNDRREILLNKLDYAISIAQDIENIKGILMDIEKEVKAL